MVTAESQEGNGIQVFSGDKQGQILTKTVPEKLRNWQTVPGIIGLLENMTALSSSRLYRAEEFIYDLETGSFACSVPGLDRWMKARGGIRQIGMHFLDKAFQNQILVSGDDGKDVILPVFFGRENPHCIFSLPKDEAERLFDIYIRESSLSQQRVSVLKIARAENDRFCQKSPKTVKTSLDKIDPDNRLPRPLLINEKVVSNVMVEDEDEDEAKFSPEISDLLEKEKPVKSKYIRALSGYRFYPETNRFIFQINDQDWCKGGAFPRKFRTEFLLRASLTPMPIGENRVVLPIIPTKGKKVDFLVSLSETQAEELFEEVLKASNLSVEAEVEFRDQRRENLRIFQGNSELVPQILANLNPGNEAL